MEVVDASVGLRFIWNVVVIVVVYNAIETVWGFYIGWSLTLCGLVYILVWRCCEVFWCLHTLRCVVFIGLFRFTDLCFVLSTGAFVNPHNV